MSVTLRNTDFLNTMSAHMRRSTLFIIVINALFFLMATAVPAERIMMRRQVAIKLKLRH